MAYALKGGFTLDTKYHLLYIKKANKQTKKPPSYSPLSELGIKTYNLIKLKYISGIMELA